MKILWSFIGLFWITLMVANASMAQPDDLDEHELNQHKQQQNHRFTFDMIEAFEKDLSKVRYCHTTADCARIYAGCPLGCFEAVNVSQQAYIKKRAKFYQTAIQRVTHTSCNYRCKQQGPLVCKDHQCELLPTH